MDNASDYGSEDSRFDSWLACSASFASLNRRKLNALGEAKESSPLAARVRLPVWEVRVVFASLIETASASVCASSTFSQRRSFSNLMGWGSVPTGVPSIAQLVERRTCGILQSRPPLEGKSSFPDRESNPGRGGEETSLSLDPSSSAEKHSQAL
ncbi:unnamed protein product [Leuciscus chuanchicus]